MASSALTCTFEGSPPLNTDIAGIGVRISTYVQAFLFIISITVSPTSADMYNQTLSETILNVSVIVSALVLGFSSNPQISLQDATVAWYFTIIPFIIQTATGKKLAHRSKLHNAVHASNWDLNLNVICLLIMYILSAGFTLAVYRHHEAFGSHPECNSAARIFLFGTHTISHRWFVAMAAIYGIFLGIVFIPTIFKLLFLACLISSTRMPRTDEERQDAERQKQHVEKMIANADPEANFEADYRSAFIISVVLVIWITFTELTVAKNRFAPADGVVWQFGQIFPLIFLAAPLLATAKAIKEFLDDAPKRAEQTTCNGKPEKRDGLLETVSKLVDVPDEEIREVMATTSEPGNGTSVQQSSLIGTLYATAKADFRASVTGPE